MQDKVKKFNKNKGVHEIPMPVNARLLDISSELGELNKEYLKSSSYGTKNFMVSENFKMEFGDVLYSLLSLANETNIDANECLDMALNKYNDRIKNKKSMGSNN